MDVSWLNKKLKSTDDVVENKLKDLNHLLDSMVLSVRKISYELRPILLDEFGLAAAMEWYLKEFEKRSGIRTYFNQPKQELKLNDAVKTNLFRIFQESLTNIARHSDAGEVTIDLTQNRELHLRIQDNGKGFNKEKITNNKTLGILGMKERASSLGWHYEIQTETGSGTTISVVIPPVKKPYL
jgi:signal transduction histidine kinase